MKFSVYVIFMIIPIAKRRAGEGGLYGVKVSNKSDKILSLSRL